MTTTRRTILAAAIGAVLPLPSQASGVGDKLKFIMSEFPDGTMQFDTWRNGVLEEREELSPNGMRRILKARPAGSL